VQVQSPVLTQHVQVSIVFTDAGRCDLTSRASLWGLGGVVAEKRVNNDCVADLGRVPEGTYHLSVTGQSFSRLDTDSVRIESSAAEHLEVKVRRTDSLQETNGVRSASLVEVTNLGIPVRARREFDKGVEFMTRHNWQKAIEKLNRAIAIYPGYSGAYNNLGVVYGQLGERDQETSALESAIRLNDHFAPAYVNLARVNITADHFPEAERLLNQASNCDPRDATTLVLLSYVEFKDGHFEDVIATARRAHALPQPHAFVHWMAARALAPKSNRRDELTTELRLFLQEEPSGARADEARHELAVLDNSTR